MQTIKEIGAMGFIIHPYIRIFAISKKARKSKKQAIAKQTVDAMQKKQKIQFKTEVIFIAFNVIITNTSLTDIITRS